MAFELIINEATQADVYLSVLSLLIGALLTPYLYYEVLKPAASKLVN